MKTVDVKTVRQYIDEDNIPVKWGGKDEYEYKFVPEVRQNDVTDGEVIELHSTSNNNTEEQTNLNSMDKKVS